MGDFLIPFDKPKPDIERFLNAVSGKKIPEKAPIMEYIIDNALMKPILEKMMGRKWVETSDKTEYIGGQMEFSRENMETARGCAPASETPGSDATTKLPRCRTPSATSACLPSRRNY